MATAAGGRKRDCPSTPLRDRLISKMNGIGGFLKRVSKHIITMPVVNNLQEVDAAAIGGRKMQYFDLRDLNLVLQLSNRYLGRSPLLLISEGEVSRSRSTQGKRAVTEWIKAEVSELGKG